MVGLKHPEAWELWRQHLLGRFSGSDLALYHKPFWYYVPSAAWQWLPWTPLILLGAAGSLRQAWRAPDSPHRFVWWWFAGQFALLSCAAGKSHVYLLHALPALAPVAVLGALRVGRWVQSGAAAVDRLGKFLLIATPVTAIGGWLAAGRWAAWLAADLYVLAALLSAAAIGLGLSLLRHRPRWVLAASVAYITIAAAYATGWVMHYRDPSLADRRFLAEVDHRLSPNDLLLGTDFIGLPRYIFYLNHAVEGYLIPEHFPPLPTDRHHAYVLARAAQAEQLKRLGEVHVVAQSVRTRRESGPQDRFTLFRVEAGVGIAAKPSAAPH
jgi:hypothetical protein